MSKSIMQSSKECFITGSTEGLHKHHCFHGIRRKAAEKYGCWVWLRSDIHAELHDRNKELDRMIERACQERFEEVYSHEEFMEIFGKSYL